MILDEMSIVDVITRLIFDAEAELHAGELLVVESLGKVETALYGRSRREISEYLRSMGVDEMIAAVNSIKQQITLDAGHAALS